MNRKGFTLTEVLIAIAIIAILLLILVPNVFVIIDKNKEKSCSSLVNNIESAAKVYVINNKYNLGFSCNSPDKTSTISITLRTLVTTGDITVDKNGKIINPFDEKDILFDINDTVYDNKVNVNVTYNCTSRQFKYEVTGIDCTNN